MSILACPTGHYVVEVSGAIPEDAFYNCDDLTSVTIPDSVTSIGAYAFYSCSSLSSVTIGESVTSIGNYAFEDCYALTSVTIPDSVTSIGEGAFNSCSSLSSVTIGESVTSIGDYAFYYCLKLSYVRYEGVSAPSYGSSCFYGTSVTSVSVPLSYSGTSFCGKSVTYDSSASLTPSRSQSASRSPTDRFSVIVLGRVSVGQILGLVFSCFVY